MQFAIELVEPYAFEYGLLLHCMHKQQDFFGCLADLRDLEEVKKVNLPRLAASRRPQDNPKARPDLQKGCPVWAYNVTGDFVAFLARD